MTPRSTYPATAAGLAAALADLGTTADEVAETLDCGNYRGIRGASLHCPVTYYLSAVIPDASEAFADDRDASLVIDGRQLVVDMPAAVATFVRRFDSGAYDRLADDEFADPDDV